MRRCRPLRYSEKCPRALAAALDKACLDHQLEMARNTRLGLPENIRQIGNRQFALDEQCKNANPRIFAGCS